MHFTMVIFYDQTEYSNPQGQGAKKMWFQGPSSSNRVWFALVWMLQWAWTGALQQAGTLQQKLRMHRAKPGTPASKSIID